MYIGEECMVRYPDGDRFIWWNAKIKSIQKNTVSVIWIEGEYRGTETPRVPHTELFLDETKSHMESMKKDIQEVKDRVNSNSSVAKGAVELITPILKQILSKLDDLNTKLETQTNFLEDRISKAKDFFDDDVVSYDSSLNRLADSLRGLSSGSVEMNDIPTFSNRKKYTSYDGKPRY